MHHSRPTVSRCLPVGLATASIALGAPCASAGLAVPAYSSRPGAAYTVYLDFGGFSYAGTWNGKAPGATPAYSVDSDASAFSATDLQNILTIWADAAEKYSALDVNVTTVDPAVAAGKAGSDAQRESYYDATARVVHTVVGGTGAWYGNVGGVSNLNTIRNAYASPTGQHTNWVFAGLAPQNVRAIGEAAAHEVGHTFGLSHQSDYGTAGTANATGTTLISEYSTNGTAVGAYAGDGTFAPVMGESYYTQRGLWRVGASKNGQSGRPVQNDYAVFAANPGLSLADDGVGHAFATATALPLAGPAVLPAMARGILTPASLSSPNPIGADSYTRDYFRFTSTGGMASLTVWDGSEYGQAGVADTGASADAVLKIYDLGGTLLGTSTRAADTLSATVSAMLGAGSYYIEVSDVGGYTSTFDPSAAYYTGGSYFLTGTTVPEPDLCILGLPVIVLRRPRRHR